MTKKQPVSSFENLETWKFGAALRQKISALTKQFPKEETYRLKDQMVRASRSVTANIAEGYGRFHFQENIQYHRQARGSLYELIDHLIVAREENYISDDQYNSTREQTITTIKLVNGYISYLKKAKANQVDEDIIDYNTD